MMVAMTWKFWTCCVWTHELSILRGRKKHKFDIIFSRLSTLGRRVGRVFLPKADTFVCDVNIELDIHKDAFTDGRNLTLFHCTKRVFDVMSYSYEHEAKTNITIAQVATEWTTVSGRRHTLVANEALHMLDVDNYLMGPDQFRDCGAKVQEKKHSLDPMIIEKS